MHHRKSFIVIVGVAVCSLALSALPAGASNHAHGRNHAPHGRKHPHPPRGGANGATATDIAKWVGEKALGAAASKGFGFLFTALGLDGASPDAAALAEIKQQLDKMSAQITTVQASIDALNQNVLQNGLDTQLLILREKTRTVKNLYDTSFLPIVDDAIALAALRKDPNASPDDIKAAEDELKADRASFITNFESRGAGEISGFIHDSLVPGSGTSLLAATGKVLLAQRRYLTTRTSLDIRAMFDGFREWEALAAYMRMERYIPLNPTAPNANWTTYERVRKEYVAETALEFQHLPPVIPPDVVIDAGPVPTLRTSTNQAPMFLPASDLGELRSRPGLANGNPIDAARGVVNAGFRATFADWQVASQRDLAGLLSGFVPAAGATPNAYLGALNATSSAWKDIAKASGIWSSDVVNQSVTCSGVVGGRTFYETVTFPSNTAVAVGGPTAAWSPRPKLDAGRTTSSSDIAGACRAYGESQFAGPNATARLMATRSTGTMGMDYAAIGGDITIKAGADLRGADLTDFILEGVDLQGVKLVGAKLKGTVLANADLTGANLAGARLDGADLSDANLTNANLTGITSVDVRGVPAALPVGWRLFKGVLVGPGADLTGADLSGSDLRSVDLTGVTSGGTDCTGCLLPSGWAWSGLPSGYFVGPRAVLPNANLAGADLRTARLDNANLRGASLAGANLTGVSLTGATLDGANLARANLSSANLTGASLPGADLTGAQLGGATLTSAVLPNATLVRANLISTNFTFANLSSADLSGAVAQRVVLRGANLTQARLIGVDLSGADLSFAYLWKTDLSRAVLIGANLTGATLMYATTVGADMSGAKLTQAGITGANLSNTKFDGVTSGGIDGTPAALTSTWRLINGFLVGKGANLRSLNASGANLTGLDLTGANLLGANLTNANLTNATLVDVLLQFASIGGANFSTDNDNKLAGIQSGGLVGTPRALPSSGRFRVTQGYFVGPSANLSNAVFPTTAQLGVSLSGTNFTNASLAGVNLAGAFMNNATLTNARLTGANLSGANLSAANLKGVVSGGVVGAPALPAGYVMVSGYIVGPDVNLSGANLVGARLNARNLTRANLAGANLTGADLSLANLTAAELTGAVLTGAVWGQTTCPNGVVQSTPCAPLVFSSQPSLTATAFLGANFLSIDVEPNLGSGAWDFIIEQRTAGGGWMPVGSYRTRGPDETATLNLAAGAYRVVVPRQNTTREATSAVVVLTR